MLFPFSAKEVKKLMGLGFSMRYKRKTITTRPFKQLCFLHEFSQVGLCSRSLRIDQYKSVSQEVPDNGVTMSYFLTLCYSKANSSYPFRTSHKMHEV